MAEYGLEDFEKVINKKLDVIVGRKFASLRSRLEKNIAKTARQLFRWMSANVINRRGNRFPSEYTDVPEWPPLSKSYAKRKGHNRFWYNRGVLDAWLYNTSPTRILGTPKVSIKERNLKDGSRALHVRIMPYPRAGNFTLPEKIYNRLFGQTKRRLGMDIFAASNDEARPIFEPSLMFFADTQLARTYRETVKEVLKR